MKYARMESEGVKKLVSSTRIEFECVFGPNLVLGLISNACLIRLSKIKPTSQVFLTCR